MLRYWYAFTPLAILGAVVFLVLPWLALFALMILSLVALVALVGLAWALVFVPYKLSRAISRRWLSRTSESSTTPLALSPVSSGERETSTQVAAKT